MDFKTLSYEEDILRNPYSLKNWWYYLEYKAEAKKEVRYLIYERAVQKLPGSYKLWFRYLSEREINCKNLCITHIDYEKTNNAFERALVHMHKMPRIWKEYLQFLTKQKKITLTRRTFDRALKSLPVTQHIKWVWPMYLAFAKQSQVPETAIRIWRRYLKVNPLEREDYIKYLKSVGKIEEAASQLAVCVNDEKFISQHGRSKHDLWKELLKLITSNPQEIKTLNVDAIIRSGIKRFSHEVGHLWNSLAEFYIRSGHLEKARDMYEEGISSVSTVRDFVMIFEAYTAYEEQILAAQMETSDVPEEEEDSDEEFEGKDQKSKEEIAIDMRLMRLESLVNRQPLLLSSVLLRQNPHNVKEWHHRVSLYKGQPEDIIRTYTDAVTTVDPQKATGKPHTLWVAFAKFYEKHNDLENSRVIYDKAALVNYKSVDDLAAIWCERAEMELRHGNARLALETLKKAAVVPLKEVRVWKKGGAGGVPVQKRLYKSTRLWSFYADLEENLGSLESTKAVYDQMVNIKVATPSIILNYATLLEEKKYFEEAFRCYEKGIGLFEYPHVYPLWSQYLKRFISRYGGTKLERTRDLFEQSVEKAPAKEGKKLYLLYAKFEEEHGLARRAMAVYDRACRAALPKDRFELYCLYINRCEEFFGVTKTREIYEQAVQNLPEDSLKIMLMKYAALEKKLGEIDRSRSIYSYASQFNDPRVDTAFWKQWHDFEVMHGNEETFRDMLRIRRSVQAQFASLNVVTAPKLQPRVPDAQATSSIEGLEQAMEKELKAKEDAKAMEAEEKTNEELEKMAKRLPGPSQNPEEINLEEEPKKKKKPQKKKPVKKKHRGDGGSFKGYD